MNQINEIIISKFESLPNEILIEYLKYFNAFEIFYSFNHLNHRFNNLICNVPLHLHFHEIEKATYDLLFETFVANPQLINQIYSIRLSNEDQCF